MTMNKDEYEEYREKEKAAIAKLRKVVDAMVKKHDIPVLPRTKENETEVTDNITPKEYFQQLLKQKETILREIYRPANTRRSGKGAIARKAMEDFYANENLRRIEYEQRSMSDNPEPLAVEKRNMKVNYGLDGNKKVEMKKALTLDEAIKKLQDIRMMDGNVDTILIHEYDEEDNTYIGVDFYYDPDYNLVGIMSRSSSWIKDERGKS